MMVANSFDLWQKTLSFLPPKRMESAYRLWLREKRDGLTPEVFEELCRDLQVALGTARWQLEEFEKAVSLSYGNRGDESTSARHRDFVYAIGSQISHVEAELREAITKQGSQPFRWVNLDKEENDDLAVFLSGTCQSFQTTNDQHVNTGSPPLESRCGRTVDSNGAYGIHSAEETQALKNVNIGMGTDYCHIIDIDTKNSSGSRDDVACQMDRAAVAKTAWSTPNFGALRIVVSNEDMPVEHLSSVEATPKDRGSRSLFWRQRCGEHFQAREALNLCIKCLFYFIQAETLSNCIAMKRGKQVSKNKDYKQGTKGTFEKDFLEALSNT